MRIYLKYLGVVLMVYAYMDFSEHQSSNLEFDAWTTIRIVALIAVGIYLLFFIMKYKKSAVIEGRQLIIRRQKRNILTIDLDSDIKVVKGLSGIKIRHISYEQIFEYSDFDEDSVKKLKSLN